MYIFCFYSVQHHPHRSLKFLLAPFALKIVVEPVAEVILGAIGVLSSISIHILSIVDFSIVSSCPYSFNIILQTFSEIMLVHPVDSLLVRNVFELAQRSPQQSLKFIH